jgi:UMF1 family MFS transporter
VTASSLPSAAARGSSFRALASWCLYDWAYHAYPTIVLTFVFATYFTQGVVKDHVAGTAQWGFALSASGIAIAVLGPVFGAIADQAGARKPWLAGFSALAIVTTAALWWVEPDPVFAPLALVLIAVSNIGFEAGIVFYNAMLPELVPPSHVGRLSGWGWGIGYLGGVICLGIALFGFVQPAAPPFGLVKAAAEHVRATALLTAAWFALFALPIFLWTPDRPATGRDFGTSLRRGIASLMDTLHDLPRHPSIALFLIAQMIYTDGLNTLFAFGGIYAANAFGMPLDEVLEFGIALNLIGGLGAIGFAWIDDWIGPKRTVILSICAAILLGGGILLVHDKRLFWGLALGLGVFFGPIQAASRSLMARLAPPALRTEMFGLYALSGKATAYLGPAVLGWATLAFSSERAGMATILAFFAVGLALLLFVKEPKSGA